MEKSRVRWVDYAKGVCIILVVMMHSTLGVEKAAGAASWLGGFVEWARPFRMPDFFLISGLFLGARIGRPWSGYLDTKLVHFAYFYLLWMTIQFGLRAPGLYADLGAPGLARAYLMGFIEPYGTLWFIYLLAVFFVVTKALVSAPQWLVFAAAALLEILPVDTGHLLIDEFAGRFVYFFAGYWAAAWIFKFAGELGKLNPPVLAAGLGVWAVANTLMVDSGLAFMPVSGLATGFAGAGAVIGLGVLCSRLPIMDWLRYLGENSIVVYLAFVLFMAPARVALLKAGVIEDLGLVSLIVTAVGIAGAVTLHWLTKGTRLGFLFRRPAWAKPGRLPVDVVGGDRRQVHNV